MESNFKNSIRNVIIKYMKKMFMKLACDNSLIHKKFYVERDQENRLMTYLENNDYNIDEAFENIIDECLSSELIKMIYELKFIEVDTLNDYYDSDTIWEKMDEIFWHIINFIGLNEMHNLSATCADNLVYDFWDIINKLPIHIEK